MSSPAVWKLLTALVLGFLTSSDDVSQCWEVPRYTFEACCRTQGFEHEPNKIMGGGSQDCWEGDFTYETCCIPELEARLLRGTQLIERGEHRKASEAIIALHFNYGGDPRVPVHARIFQTFQKAVKEYKKDLDEEPHTLSYFDVLFRGLGTNCNPASEAEPGYESRSRRPGDPLTVYEEWSRCCKGGIAFASKPCITIFEMIGNALGRGRHQNRNPERDAYYLNMSEMWAFHHFTPSLLSDAPEGPNENLVLARNFDSQLAGIFEALDEPIQGIVWAPELVGVGTYRSPKYNVGVFGLTVLLGSLRRAGVSQAVDLFEIGAGYGSLPRMLSFAKPQLEGLDRPVNIRRYTVMDVRFVIDLQNWYLSSTAGDRVIMRDWADSEHVKPFDEDSPWVEAASLWPELSTDNTSGPLQVDFVDASVRDIFAHFYSEAHVSEVTSGSTAARALIAINSWHELQMPEYLWYYNTFVAAPAWRMGVDWILYVSNNYWDTKRREELLLKPRKHFHFEVHYEYCTVPTCFRVLRRVPPDSSR